MLQTVKELGTTLNVLASSKQKEEKEKEGKGSKKKAKGKKTLARVRPPASERHGHIRAAFNICPLDINNGVISR